MAADEASATRQENVAGPFFSLRFEKVPGYSNRSTSGATFVLYRYKNASLREHPCEKAYLNPMIPFILRAKSSRKGSMADFAHRIMTALKGYLLRFFRDHRFVLTLR
jgi:hypothetical protein